MISLERVGGKEIIIYLEKVAGLIINKLKMKIEPDGISSSIFLFKRIALS